jgi:hypothetical protein
MELYESSWSWLGFRELFQDRSSPYSNELHYKVWGIHLDYHRTIFHSLFDLLASSQRTTVQGHHDEANCLLASYLGYRDIAILHEYHGAFSSVLPGHYIAFVSGSYQGAIWWGYDCVFEPYPPRELYGWLDGAIWNMRVDSLLHEGINCPSRGSICASRDRDGLMLLASYLGHHRDQDEVPGSYLGTLDLSRRPSEIEWNQGCRYIWAPRELSGSYELSLAFQRTLCAVRKLYWALGAFMTWISTNMNPFSFLHMQKWDSNL